MKRCGKSAPRPGRLGRHGKPHSKQEPIGELSKEKGWPVRCSRVCSLLRLLGNQDPRRMFAARFERGGNRTRLTEPLRLFPLRFQALARGPLYYLELTRLILRPICTGHGCRFGLDRDLRPPPSSRAVRRAILRSDWPHAKRILRNHGGARWISTFPSSSLIKLLGNNIKSLLANKIKTSILF